MAVVDLLALDLRNNLLIIVAGKRRGTCEQDVHDDSDRPDVAALIILHVRDDLRSNVVHCAVDALQQLPRLEAGRVVKVNELAEGLSIDEFLINQDFFGLQITVHYTLRVAVGNCP